MKGKFFRLQVNLLIRLFCPSAGLHRVKEVNFNIFFTFFRLCFVSHVQVFVLHGHGQNDKDDDEANHDKAERALQESGQGQSLKVFEDKTKTEGV